MIKSPEEQDTWADLTVPWGKCLDEVWENFWQEKKNKEQS